MSIPYLIDDVLEVIFDFVYDVADDPTRESQKNFATLARVSKRFLPLARSRLYHRPIDSTTGNPPVDAPRLLSSLVRNNGYLGRLVRCLFGLDIWTSKLPRSGPAFHLQLLRACPAINTLALLLSSRADLAAVKAALSKTKGVNKLALTVVNTAYINVELGRGPSEWSGSARWDDSVIHEVLNWSSFANVSKLEFDLRRHPSMGLQGRSVTLPLTSLILDAGDSSLSQVLQFFPVKLTPLNVFVLALLDPSDADIEYALSLVNSRVRLISLNNTSSYRFGPSLQEYRTEGRGQRVPNTRVPIPLLQRFSFLTELTLVTFRGPSLALLESLVESSPLLQILRFIDSWWITEKPVPLDASRQEYLDLVFEEEEVVKILQRLHHLYQVHLGFLPFLEDSSKNVMALMKRFGKERGVSIRWDTVTDIPTMSLYM